MGANLVKLKLDVGATVLLMAAMCTVPLLGQEQAMVSKDAAAVKAAVTNYVEAYYSGNVALIEKTLHPNYLKHTISTANG